MEKLRLTNAVHYTNAAMLLFSKDPDKWQFGSYTKIGFFETDADLRYQDEIHGSILEQIDKIIEVLHLKFMKAKITYEGIQRIERYFVPDAALREALIHKLRISSSQFHYRYCRLFMAGRYGPLHTDGCW